MAEFVVKLADERGHTHQQIEQGYSAGGANSRTARFWFITSSF